MGREREFVLDGEPRHLVRGDGRERATGLCASVCERAGLDWSRLRARRSRTPRLRARVDASTAALDELGHWGVPVLVFEGELFWGQDRIEDLEVALQGAGLERR